MNSVPRTEHDILFCIARRELGGGHKLRQLLRHDLDWDYLLTTASNHGLMPLLHKHLNSVSAEIPVHVLSRLKRESIGNAQNVLHLTGKLLKLYRLLKENGVRIAIFKGAQLSEMAYGELSLRQAGDIDVLIEREQFRHAQQLLESLGYEMTPSLTEAQLASHLATHCEIQFMRDDWFTVVDLHWALAPRNFVFKLDTDDVLARLQRVAFAGTEIETLATEDLILYQSMHGAKHLWRRLEWISSLGELIRSAEAIDWDLMMSRATKAHATRMLALGLRLAEGLSGTNVPVSVDKEGEMKRMAGEILSTILTVSGAAESTETNLYNIKIMDRKRDALISALRAIFVPTLTDWSSLTLPSSLHPLYYAYRPLRLSRVYSSSLWRRLSSRGAACW
jgi:hypothetical protein